MIIPVIGSAAVMGARDAVSHSLIPMSAFVRQDPSQVAAPVIRILPQRIPLVVLSLKFISRSPSTLVMKRMMQPKSGGMAVDQLLMTLYTSGNAPLIKLGPTHRNTVKNTTPRMIFSLRSAAGTVPRSPIAFSGRISVISSGR